MMKLILATRNSHKARELAAMLDLGLSILTLDDIRFSGEMVEDGMTFEENASHKLRYVVEFLMKDRNGEELKGCCVVADDSGLEVDALNGAPGIFSARYAGEPTNDLANIAKLMKELQGVPGPGRKARFCCVLAASILDPTGRMVRRPSNIFTGVCEGKIGFKSKGKNGFGYDPIFFPEGFCRTFAELTPDEKNRVSHRAQAAQQLQKWLKSFKK